MRVFDDLKRREDDNPTIGIIFCTDKWIFQLKYTDVLENWIPAFWGMDIA